MIKGKIGLEIESYTLEIDNLIQYCKTKNWSYEDDGSIREPRNRNYRTIEFKVGVYKIEDLNKMIEDLKIPFEMVKVNNSCGLHINVSFDNITDYYKLLSWDFVNNFQEKIKREFKTQKEIKRLNNHYCKLYLSDDEFNILTERQLKTTSKVSERYFSVNYNSFNLHKTIEFRIFASTTSIKKLKSYLKLLFESIEEHLSKTTIQDKTLNISLKRVTQNDKKPIIKTDILQQCEIIEILQQKQINGGL